MATNENNEQLTNISQTISNILFGLVSVPTKLTKSVITGGIEELKNWNFADSSITDNWLDRFTGYSGSWGELYNAYFADFDYSSPDSWLSGAKGVGLSLLLGLSQGAQTLGTAVGQAVGLAFNETALNEALETIDAVTSGVSDVAGGLLDASVNFSQQLGDTISSFTENVGSDNVFLSVISKGIGIFADSALKTYQDGISETTFGSLMENSWSKTGDSFLSTFANGSSSYSVTINQTTPLDPGENQTNLYGTMMLGAPPLFNHIADPRNRSIINTFLRDAKFISLTPGYPKYNGSNYLLATNDDALHQTPTGESMLAYLLKNGIDSDFAKKDRRYYTFATDYEDYYAYLETMLNTIWIKMGLGTESANKFNIFTFFKILDNGRINTQNADKLIDRYKSSLGFFVNPDGVLTESINSQVTSFGSNIASDVNSSSEEYQKINYMTGMGTGGSGRNAARLTQLTSTLTGNVLDFINDAASNTIGAISDLTKDITSLRNITAAAVNIPLGIMKDTIRFYGDRDMGALLQSYATTNGMRVVYPELWSDSSFSKTVNINFEFISPYGDPLSIFQYVMVPFAALLCFAMPRQAADNGYVSPFFVRADIPGLFSMDLGLISDFTWTRGGNNNLWTKDGLPRAISGSFTISDLYPYLAMTKRFSFLSANPNYTVFLDNLSGFHAVYDSQNTSGLNDYWKQMLNRINGDTDSIGLWNKYNTASTSQHKKYGNTPTTNRTTMSNTSLKWFRGAN